MDRIETLDRPDIVRVREVAKRFVVRKDNSLKERLVTLGRLGRRHRDEFWALRDVDFTVAAGTTIGLIGHNGSGKSTLLKVVGGIIDPTRGGVERRGRIAALLELGAGFHPDLTGRENVFLNASILGLSREETEAQLDDILAFAAIGDFIDTQVKFYSSGMYVRLAFAVAVHTDPDLLLVDEVLAVGDEAFQRKCMDKIRSFQEEGRTIVLVTHNLGQVQELCDRALLLDHGQLVYDGEPREAVSRFRDLLEEDRLEEVARSEPEDQVDREFFVTSPSARPQKPGPRGELMNGDDLLISFDFHSLVEREKLMLAIQIDNTLGQRVYSTTTRLMEYPLEPFTGVRKAEFTISDTRFGPGKFFVNISVIDHFGVHLYDWPQSCSFDSHDYIISFGMVSLTPKFRITGS